MSGFATSTGPRDGRTVDLGSLSRQLSDAVEGEVRFDLAARGAYSQDASHYRQVPIGVVVPRHRQDVIDAVRVCREFDVPILGRGGGTSLAGQCCNVAVVLDFTRHLNRVLEIDPARRVARVEPGCVLDDLRAAAAEHGLTFGPDPATHDHCTLGGMIMNNSCGIHSVLAQHYGPGPRTEDQVVSLEVLTYRGDVIEVGPVTEEELDELTRADGARSEIYRGLRHLRDRARVAIRERFPDIPRRVSGYNLPALLPENGFNPARGLCGTEGTCVLVLEATVQLVWKPEHQVLVVCGYEDVFDAVDHVPEIMQHRPIGLEGMDDRLLQDMRHKGFHTDDLQYLPKGHGFLLVELGADDRAAVERSAHDLVRALNGSARPPLDTRIYDDEEKEKKVWEARESGLGATAWVPGERPTWPGWEDAAVPPARLGSYLRAFRKLLDRFGLDGDLYGHFGQGCVHTRIDFDLQTREGIDLYRAFIDKAADLVIEHGGSLSGEHGDGQSRAVLLGKMYGEELIEAFREFKRIWDPDGRMNPGKVVDPHEPQEDLQLGLDYHPKPRSTWFHYSNDRGGFEGAAKRCVGVGKCRRADGGVMCPSFMVTREEIHSTRGRARLLFEMMRGDVVTDGWRSKAVKEALDLCLACKGCKSDCPVDVDMATYKAEFLAHHYRFRLRPRQAYAMGWARGWTELAARLPRVANLLAHARGVSSLLKGVAGVARERELPWLAEESLRAWFRRRPRTERRGQRVILWPDTFNDFFHPHVGRAAVEVLESAGYDVVVPARARCCGRPLYDYGFLGMARRRVRRIVQDLAQEIRAGTPIVGLEPSCVATFRDEAPDLMPQDADVQRLARQYFTLGEFVEKHGDAFDLRSLGGRALVHAHCHHQSVLDWDSEERVLDRLGLAWSRPETSCCGMAGAFGFERGRRHEVSIALGERRLAPAVRAAPPDSRIVADGFSCREQIRQLTGRLPLHLAELLREAMKSRP